MESFDNNNLFLSFENFLNEMPTNVHDNVESVDLYYDIWLKDHDYFTTTQQIEISNNIDNKMDDDKKSIKRKFTEEKLELIKRPKTSRDYYFFSPAVNTTCDVSVEQYPICF